MHGETLKFCTNTVPISKYTHVKLERLFKTRTEKTIQ